MIRITRRQIRRLITEVVEEEATEEVDGNPEDCVLSNFQKFLNLGKDEQVSLYTAFKGCIDTSFVNSDNLQIVHWFNLYEGNPVTLLKDFIVWLNKYKLNISGSLSAVGYTNFTSQARKMLHGKIGFMLDGPVGLAFSQDAQTERGEGAGKLKMPGKIRGGASSGMGAVEAWIPKMVLDSDSYYLGVSGTPNEFIMVNPKVKGIILDIEWIKEEAGKMGISSEGVSINELLGNLAKIILALNVRVINFQGKDIKGELQGFANADAGDIKAEIIQTLVGEKELSDADRSNASAPTLINLLANYITLDRLPSYYPGTDFFTGNRLKTTMKKLNDEGKLSAMLGPKRSEPVNIGYDAQKPVVRKTYYIPGGGEERLYPEDLIRRLLDGTPVYYQKIVPYFSNPEHADYEQWGNAIEEMPWLKDVKHFARWLDMTDYNGSKMNSPIQDTLIPWMAAVEYDGTLPAPPPVPPDKDSRFVAKMNDGSTVLLKKKAGDVWYLIDDVIEDAWNLTDYHEKV